MREKNIKALAWDFDGTIVDTREKNLRVTKEIIERLTGRSPYDFPALRTVESYDLSQRQYMNWREFYLSELGLTDEQTDEAGRLWTHYQLQDETPTPVFEGIEQVVEALQTIPHGIVSQNARNSISRALEAAGLLSYFRCIVGYEEVDLRKQKPEPDGLVRCIEELTRMEPGYVFYIGDHEVDMKTALNANQVFERRELDVRVITIAAVHAHVEKQEWNLRPDYVVEDPVEIIGVIQGFKPTS